MDRPALRALPAQSYRYVAIKTVKVNIDYHVHYDNTSTHCPTSTWAKRWSCTPMTSWCSATRQQLVATHPRHHTPGTTTDPAHIPTPHRKHHQWTEGMIRLKQIRSTLRSNRDQLQQDLPLIVQDYENIRGRHDFQ